MKSPWDLLPLKIGDFEIRPIRWSDFKGEVQQKMPWSAHIYWWIDYKISDDKKKKLSVALHIGEKSWVRCDRKCAHLLNHEQGHYLIGAICVLEFMRRVDSKRKDMQGNFDDFVFQTFDRTIKEYQQLERKYDDETEHRMNFNKQLEWDGYIYDKLTYYKLIYDKSKKKFVKFSQSPTKLKQPKIRNL